MAAFFISLICFPPPKFKDSSPDNRKRRTLLIFSHPLFSWNLGSGVTNGRGSSTNFMNSFCLWIMPCHHGSSWFHTEAMFSVNLPFLILQQDKGEHPSAVASAILCHHIKQHICNRIRQCDCRSRKKTSLIPILHWTPLLFWFIRHPCVNICVLHVKP